jgi:hypothetical protein
VRLGRTGYPCILLGHRKREFLETTAASLRKHATGITDLVVVDDSGDAEHHAWLDDNGYQFVTVDPYESQGYLAAMNVVWETAQCYVAEGVPHVLLWEEDFVLHKPFDLIDLADLLTIDPKLAQVNLQRQAVYKIERRLGYMQSHQRRGYDLHSVLTVDIPWVRRRRPFTTNPGMIQGSVLSMEWPTREEADATPGGAEPAMSLRLEHAGYHFGWLGLPNHPHVEHVGTVMKSGKGY